MSVRDYIRGRSSKPRAAEDAATKIQAGFRGYAARKGLKKRTAEGLKKRTAEADPNCRCFDYNFYGFRIATMLKIRLRIVSKPGIITSD